MPQSPRATDATRRNRTSRRRALGTMGSLLAVAVTLGTIAATAGPAGADPSAVAHGGSAAPARSRTVTLITGDRVHVVTDSAGRTGVALEPGPDGTLPRAIIEQHLGDTFVIPQVAIPLLAAHRLDRALFDVTGLLRQHYDDAHRNTIPVIVDYGSGATAAVQARTASLSAAHRTVTIASLGMAAFAAQKSAAGVFWADLTAGSNSAGAPTRGRITGTQ